jgi:two-component system OmpR family sensor kinase
MHIRSIGTKLTVWYTSLLTVTLLILGVVAYGLLVYGLSHEIDSALKGVGEVMAQRARANGATFFPSNVNELFRRYLGFSPLDPRFEMLDPLGRQDPRQPQGGSSKLPLSPNALKNASRGLSTFETVESDGSYPVRILTMPVIDAGRVTNLVQVAVSLENMHQTRRRFLLIMAAVVPLGLLLAGGGGCLLARRALKPVARMAQAAERISGEHLSERLQETGSGDELDRLARTLNAMLGRLDDSFNQMRQFSADASHELQTPLTILKGEVEVALRSQRSPEEYQRILESGLDEINRINRLVEGLLLLARADSGMLRMDRRPVNLKELSLEVCDQMKVMADERSICLRTDSLDSVTLLGDREHLRRLLLNLVDNAIKYTSQNGSVILSLQADEEWACLKISDTGIGLSKEEQAQIFSRFHRAAEARARDEKGVGLGLNIACSIAKAHGGTIEVESTPGRGSTFAVLLPTNPTFG